MNIDDLIDKHYGSGGLLEKIRAGLILAGKNLDALSVDDLAPVDAFHTRGWEATAEMAALANLKASDLVLDVGCGTGGTARHLAHRHGCRVAGVDLTGEYVAVGNELSRLVGLSDRVELCHGSALEIPWADESFDAVWTEHVQMNIVDKTRFYSELARVLKPEGRMLFHDVFRGRGSDPLYPVPWAEDASISALATEPQARAMMEQAGFEVDQWTGKVPESVMFFEKIAARMHAQDPPPTGVHMLMGQNAKIKIGNLVRNLSENRVTIAMGSARKKAAA